MKCNITWSYLTTLSLFILDRYTKSWALANLQYQDLYVFPGVNFSLSLNRGISWSLLSFSSPLLFWMLTFFIISMLIWFSYLAFYSSTFSSATLGKLLVISGATSNIIDRFLYGGVIDFIECTIHSWHWPSFNIADTIIVFGIGIIVWRTYYDRLVSEDA